MTAFYNEPDPYAATWLENLIAAGHIAPGVVDRRPIQEIEAFELAGFTQCHFFRRYRDLEPCLAPRGLVR